MLKDVVVKAAQVAVGVFVGVKASDAFDKGVEAIKKVVKAKKGEA